MANKGLPKDYAVEQFSKSKVNEEQIMNLTTPKVIVITTPKSDSSKKPKRKPYKITTTNIGFL